MRTHFYVRQLDGLRFCAFLLVFVHHLSPFFYHPGLIPDIVSRIQTFGWMGVDLFLVLSAFLITKLLLLEKSKTGNISIKQFYMRRIFRIWPLYFFMLFLGFLVLPWVNADLGSAHHDSLIKHHLLPYLLFIGNFSAGIRGYADSHALSHLWTISLEEQFYILLPIIFVVLSNQASRIKIACLAMLLFFFLGVRVSLYLMEVPTIAIWTNTFARPDPLILGVLLAYMMDSKPFARFIAKPAVPFVGLALVMSVMSVPSITVRTPHLIWQYLFSAMGFALVVGHCSVNPDNRLSRALGLTPLVWLGKISYGLYVFHFLGIDYGGRVARLLLGDERGPILSVSIPVLALAFTLVAATLSYYTLERPFLLLKRRVSVIQSREA